MFTVRIVDSQDGEQVADMRSQVHNHLSKSDRSESRSMLPIRCTFG